MSIRPNLKIVNSPNDIKKPQTLKDIRLDYHISLNDLAYESSVSRHAVMRMEQLCYPTPLPSVIIGLSDITGISEQELVDAYMRDVISNRAFSRLTSFAHRRLLNEALEHLGNLVSDGMLSRLDKHPFQAWRELVFSWQRQNISRIYFCGAVTVHPATLDKYESFKNDSIPEPLVVALHQCGVEDNIIDYFRGRH